jgi:hypothetical protein
MRWFAKTINFSSHRKLAVRERRLKKRAMSAKCGLAHCAAQFFADFEVRPEIRGFSKSVEHFTQEWVSADRKFDRLANTAEHFHESIDGELGRFLIHYIGDTWT